eukprot:CAMPEP_0179458632 /NCGR_PEP_ID=MMETSP0799-20121207/42146_1 /TAXON_ID=46947 /ORGANISM="Geminigera cryophila, Strain CCMP2564" /LENGTH=48 /DNA_ID= /DNA_START= /DNA_END= /DNA_ORIENTATION=
MASSPTSSESEANMSNPSLLLAAAAPMHNMYTNGRSSAQQTAQDTTAL